MVRTIPLQTGTCKLLYQTKMHKTRHSHHFSLCRVYLYTDIITNKIPDNSEFLSQFYFKLLLCETHDRIAGDFIFSLCIFILLQPYSYNRSQMYPISYFAQTSGFHRYRSNGIRSKETTGLPSAPLSTQIHLVKLASSRSV